MEFDLTITWQQLEDRLAKTTNLRHRKMLETVVEHAKAEAAGSVDRLLATLNDDPQYHFWSGGKDWGPKGRDAVRAYYESFVASGAGFFESYKPRIVVDDDNVVTESEMRQLVPGTIALQRGYDVPDANGHYIVYARTAIFWPFNEACELIGEDSYGSSDTSVWEQVPEDALPEAYVTMLHAIGLSAVAT
jgi:SnoaL-like protein